MESNNNLENQEEFKIRGGWWYAFTKRIFDFFSSLILILLISWFLLIIFIINLFATKGHPFFNDKRIGKKGKKIKVFKFRTMYYDAESNIDKYLTPEQKEIWLRERKIDNDPRITKFGRFLRKTSIDELPQLFNILFGTLSVVGPRPITQKELSNFTEAQLNIILKAKPGLTGYWQTNGRSDASFGKRVELESYYSRHRGFQMDFKIFLKTFGVLFRGL